MTECVVLQTVPSWLHNLWCCCRWRLALLILLLTGLSIGGATMGLGLGCWYIYLTRQLSSMQVADTTEPSTLIRHDELEPGSDEEMAESVKSPRLPPKPDEAWHFELLKQWDCKLRELHIRLDKMSFNGPIYSETADCYYLDMELTWFGDTQQLVQLFNYQHQLQPNTQWVKLEWQADSKKRLKFEGKAELSVRIWYMAKRDVGDDAHILDETQSLPPVSPGAKRSLFAATISSLSELSPEELVMVGWLRTQLGITALLQTAEGEIVRVKQGDLLGQKQERVLKINQHRLTTNCRSYEL